MEQRYAAHFARIHPQIGACFAVFPKTPYGVRRADPVAEAGMTYGYYAPATGAEPRGLYRYNGSNLANRSMVTSAHLIYHELIPGHHLRIALASESRTLHPVMELVSFGAFEEGWAEYAAELAGEVGGLVDPYDRYGHLVSQRFLAARLVVDTGMNELGSTLERAREYLRANTFESDAQIETETLRYSTDVQAQALDYRMGYEAMMTARERARRELGARLDIAAFNTAISDSGAMPLDVLDAHVGCFIAAAKRGPAGRVDAASACRAPAPDR